MDKNTKKILQKIRDAFSQKNDSAAKSAVRELVRHESTRWMSLLLLKSGMSGPESEDFSRQLVVICESIKASIQEDSNFDPNDGMIALGVVEGLVCVSRTMSAIKQSFMALEFWKASRLTRLWRLSTFIETQAVYLRKSILDSATVQGWFDPIEIAKLSVPVAGREGGSTNMVLGFESTVDAVEQVMRVMFHRMKEPLGELEFVSPYEDPDFEALLVLFSSWNRYADLWARIKFNGWLPVFRSDGIIWTPPVMDDFVRSEVGNVRERLYLQQAIMFYALMRKEDEGAVSIQDERRLVDSIVLPEPGRTWGVDVDCDALRGLVSLDDYVQAADAYARIRHLEPVLDQLETQGGVPWQTRLAVRRVLHVLAGSLKQVRQRGVDELSHEAECGTIVAVDKFRLGEVVSAATGMSVDECVRGVDAVVFDEKRKRLEFWDQPLIPIDGNRVLIIPSVVAVAHPMRTVEHLASESSGTIFDSRGTPFETEVSRRLANETGSTPGHGIKFNASDGRQVEYDLCLWWQGHLFLFELKCLKSITSPSDEFRARGEIEKALEQLGRRVRLIASDWKVFCDRAGELSLPEVPPSVENIHPVVLTNIMQFTGLFVGGAAVVDDSCLFRYFGEPEVRMEVYGRNEMAQSESLLRIREEANPTPSGLWKYLCAPPQVDWVRSQLQVQEHALLVDRGAPRQFRVVAVFGKRTSEVEPNQRT